MCQQRLDFAPQFNVTGTLAVENFCAARSFGAASRQKNLLGARVALGRHRRSSLSSRRSQARQAIHSFSTVLLERASAVAISSMVMPAKNRISTIRALRG